MDLIKTILGTNLVGVILGGFISLISVYFVEFLKDRNSKKDHKLKVYQEIRSALLKFRYFSDFEMQFDILFSYHKRVSELLDDKFHEKEAQRRQLQLEEHQIKILELGAIFEQLSSQYHFYFGRDDKYDALLKKIVGWQSLTPVDYDTVKTVRELDKLRLDDSNERSEKIKNTLGKFIDELYTYLESKMDPLFIKTDH